ncbi:Uncharacterised protein [Mycobacteroides abscessus subsp. abscessus]|nr:Uncharacterised protein [Mycobacteroides abscessus subsp. abscessus]
MRAIKSKCSPLTLAISCTRKPWSVASSAIARVRFHIRTRRMRLSSSSVTGRGSLLGRRGEGI